MFPLRVRGIHDWVGREECNIDLILLCVWKKNGIDVLEIKHMRDICHDQIVNFPFNFTRKILVV